MSSPILNVLGKASDVMELDKLLSKVPEVKSISSALVIYSYSLDM
jgi:hypothetical protein